MGRRWFVAGLVVAVPLVLFIVLSGVSWAFRDEASGSAAISEPVSRIVVDAEGDVRIAGDETAERISLGWTSRYFAREPDVDWRVDAGTLVVDSRCDGMGWLTNCSTDLELRVPAGLEVQITADSGDVEIDGRTGALEVQTDSGDIVLRADAPAIAASVDSGDLAVEGRSADVVAAADSGDVRIELRGDPPTHVDASADSGDVVVTVPSADYAVSTEVDSGDEEVTGVRIDSRAPRTIVASADSGDVTVTGA